MGWGGGGFISQCFSIGVMTFIHVLLSVSVLKLFKMRKKLKLKKKGKNSVCQN